MNTKKEALKYYIKKLTYFFYDRSILNDIIILFRSPGFYKKYEKGSIMSKLCFEVTNICNANCIFCAYRILKKDTSRKVGVMRFEVFKKALDEFILMGGKRISFTPTIGDPLLDPGLMKKIKYAVDKKSLDDIYFYTNGIALSKNNIYKELIDSGITSIEISTAGFEKKVWEETYQARTYNNFLNGLHNLLNYNKKRGGRVKIDLNLRSPQKPQRILSSPDFKKYIEPFLDKKVTYNFLLNYDNWGGKIKKNDLKGVMRFKRIPRATSVPCKKTFDAAILFDGSIRLCACRIKETEFDDLVIGNIKENSLEEIFHGEKARNIRKNFVENNLPEVCKKCSLYEPITEKVLVSRMHKNKDSSR